MSIVLVVKFVFRGLIPDKPEWVIDEEERQKAQKQLLKGGEEIINSPSRVENDQEETHRKDKKLKNKINSYRKELYLVIAETQRRN